MKGLEKMKAFFQPAVHPEHNGVYVVKITCKHDELPEAVKYRFMIMEGGNYCISSTCYNSMAAAKDVAASYNIIRRM